MSSDPLVPFVLVTHHNLILELIREKEKWIDITDTPIIVIKGELLYQYFSFTQSHTFCPT